jgi:hypothetical protein
MGCTHGPSPCWGFIAYRRAKALAQVLASVLQTNVRQVLAKEAVGKHSNDEHVDDHGSLRLRAVRLSVAYSACRTTAGSVGYESLPVITSPVNCKSGWNNCRGLTDMHFLGMHTGWSTHAKHSLAAVSNRLSWAAAGHM